MSVFWLPLSQAVGLTAPARLPGRQHAAHPPDRHRLRLARGRPQLGVLPRHRLPRRLGRHLGRLAGTRGPAQAPALVAALCWPGGLAVAALGASRCISSGSSGWAAAWWAASGSGWATSRPCPPSSNGSPTGAAWPLGLAIMGFGGGAMIGSPLAARLMAHLSHPHQRGRGGDLPHAGRPCISCSWLGGAFALSRAAGRLRAPGLHGRPPWPRAAPWPLGLAWRTPQFWLLWGVLCLNVSAGIGVLDVASPMLQEIFAGRLIGQPGTSFTAARSRRS